MRLISFALGGVLAVCPVSAAWAQRPPAAGSDQAAQAPAQATPPRVTTPPVTVVATKEPADPAKLPVAVTAVPANLLRDAGIVLISDAGAFSPNTHFTEFTARKLSNARIRGVGASPANPGVTTYVDGVPQFNATTSSTDLIDIGQVEFVRGPQSALFGRNALGGLINITTGLPSLTRWTGAVSAPFGSAGQFDLRASASGPLVSGRLAAGVSLGYGRRDGFTVNTLTGRDLDRRSAVAAKGQLLWTPSATFDARVIVSGERARDGDYALNDLSAVRATPFRVQRDIEGSTARDVLATTILARKTGSRLTLSSTTGIVNWETVDATDLDYSPLPLATRDNRETATQFTQEVRAASSPNAAVALSTTLALKWQAGVFVFAQRFDQLARNTFAPFVLSPFVPVAVVNRSPEAALDDTGIGLYGQATFTWRDRLDVSLGARADRERKSATLLTSFEPMLAPPVAVQADRTFSDVSPQLAAAFRVEEDTTIFATAGRAYKAGGFNPVSLPGGEAYAEEHAWNVEGGVKTTRLSGRLSAAASVFSITWDDLQLNVPIPGAPGQFSIANIGGATSRGVEVELVGRPAPGVDAFGAFGITRARFAAGTSSAGTDVSGRTVPNTPAYTATFGAQVSRQVVPAARLYARADIVCVGAFEYDEANTAGQDAYRLTNLRVGLRGRRLFAEAWVRNAFDTRYVPLAFAYPGFTASGFLAEPGRPRTFGLSAGVTF